jgi:dihydrolipoamide dehydrogenase
MKYNYDIIIIGGGPGGYVGAIRGAQLGKKVAIIEKESLGGICANWGCIPTKALLKNAYILDLVKNASKYGIDISSYKINWNKIIQRSRNISKRLSKGVEYLIKKNKIKYISGTASFIDKNTLLIESENSNQKITAKNIIIATGTMQRNLPGLTIDGEQIISSREAMILDKIPKDMVIIGAGAIGVEFAHLYNSFGILSKIIASLEEIICSPSIVNPGKFLCIVPVAIIIFLAVIFWLEFSDSINKVFLSINDAVPEIYFILFFLIKYSTPLLNRLEIFLDL